MRYPYPMLYYLLLVLFTLSPSAWSLSLIDSWQEGKNGISGLDGAIALAISPDDNFIYSAGFNADSIGIYQRDDTDGRLSLVGQVVDEAGGISGLNGVSALSISSDGTFLYALGTLDNSLNVFARNTSSGMLNLTQTLSEGVGGVSGLQTPASLVLSPDGAQLYVGGAGISQFNRNSSTGELSFSGQIQNGSGVSGTNNSNRLVLSSDGAHLYVVSLTEHSVTHFQRAGSGALSFVKSYVDGLDEIDGLRGAYSLSLNSTDSLLFVSASIDNTVVVFERDASGALSFKQQLQNTDALVGVRSVIVSPNDANLYTVANSSGAVADFDIGNSLTLKDYLKEGSVNISGALGGASDLVIDKSGRHLYTAALTSDSIALFSTTATDLRVNASASPSLAALNDVVSFNITVSNQGPSVGNGVILSGNAPAGLSIETLNPAQGSCSQQNSDFSCQLGTIAIAESVEVSISARAQALGTQNLSFSVEGGDPDPVVSNNNTVAGTQIIATIPKADLIPSISVNIDPVVISGEFIYSLEVSNLSTDNADNVIIEQTLPAGVGFNRTIASQGSCDSPVNSLLRCQLGTLNGNSQAQIKVELIAPSLSSTLQSTITVSSDTIDPDESNNSSSISSEAKLISADLEAVSLIADKDDVNVGETVTYTAVVWQKSGATLAGGLTVKQQFSPEASVRFLSASSQYAGAPDQLEPCELKSTGLISCDLGTVDALANSMTVQISVMPIAAGSLSSGMEVSANVLDVDTSNNQQTTSITVSGEPVDLSVSLTSEPSAPILNQALDYQISIKNPSTLSTAANVVVRSAIPSGVTYIGALPQQGSCVEDAGNLTCGLGDIAPSSSINIRVSVIPTTADTITNSVNVSTNSFDNNELNNSASLSLNAGEAQANLSVNISGEPNSIGVDENLAYQVTVTNSGPNIANNIQLSQLLGDGSIYLNTIEPPNGQCSVVDKTISCQLTQLAVDASVVFSHNISTSSATTLNTSVSVAAAENDAAPDNNQASLSTTVLAPPNLFYVESYQNGVAGVEGLGGASDMAISDDGAYLYVAGFQEDAVAVYQRHEGTGGLTLLQVVRDGINNIAGLDNPSSLRLSEDQSRLYVASFGSNSIVVFNRDEQGLLSFAQQIQGPVGLSLYGMATQGAHLYVGAVSANAVLAFVQQGNTLESIASYQNGQAGIEGLQGVNALALSPDGRYLYAVSISDHALVVFARDTSTGALTYQQNLKGFSGLQQAGGVTVSADSRFVYTAGAADNSIAIFRQDGQLTYVSSVTDIRLSGVNGLHINAGQNSLYAAAGNANALVSFERDNNTGLLTLSNSFANGDENISQLTGAKAVLTSPAGQHIYTAALTANSLSLFRLPSADVLVELRATPENVKAGSSVIYNATVRNIGADGSTGVLLTVTLPTNLALDSVQSDQGQACEHIGQTLTCAIGAIAKNRSVDVSLNTTPQGQGDYPVTAIVSASQADPDNTNNQAQASSRVAGNANLELSLSSNGDTLILGGEAIELRASIVNTGPSDASNVQLGIEGSPLVQVSSIDFPAGSCQADGAMRLNCRIDSLANQSEAVLRIGLVPQSQGVASFSAQTSADQDDPTSPNQASYSLEIASNIINDNRDNTGNTLENVVITSTGVVNEGIVSGTITNQGILHNVTISAGSTILGGGTFSGRIINQGTITHATLSPNSQITGGTLQGRIEGDANAPARLNTLALGSNANLYNVILGEGMQIAEGVLFNAGVRFASAELVPTDIDLSNFISRIKDPVTSSLALDLSQDAIFGGTALLTQINAIAEIAQSGGAFIQHADGIVEISLGGIRFSLLPSRLKQDNSSREAGIYPLADEVVELVTNAGRVLTFTPAINNPNALQQVLQASLLAQANGNIKVLQNGGYLLLRPQLQSLLSLTPLDFDGMQLLKLQASPASGVEQMQLQQRVQGQTWQQNFAAYPADIDSIQAIVDFAPNASDLYVDNQGVLHITINGQVARGLLAYQVNSGAAAGGLDFISTADTNGDGIDDFLIRYPNGESQILYYLP